MKFEIRISQFITKIEQKQWYLAHLQIRHFIKKYFKYFNDFQNRNFENLWLKWTRTMAMKPNQTFLHRIYSNLTSFLIGLKILKHSNDFFMISTFQVKWNKIKRDMCKSDCIFPCLQNTTVFQWTLFVDKPYL